MTGSRAIAMLALLAGAGCLQANSDGGGIGVNQTSCDTCKHNSNVGGAAGGGASTSGSSSGGSSSGGAATGGASSGGASTGALGGGSSSGGASGGGTLDGGGITCGSILALGTPISCPGGSLDLSSQLVDYLQCTVVAGGTVEGLNPAGIPYTAASGLSASDGTFSLCLPQNSPFSLVASAAQYPTTYFAELQDVQPQELEQLGMLSNSFIDALPSLVPNGLDLGKGLLLVKVNTSIACRTLRSGWTVEMSIGDGGTFPDGGYELVYLGSTGVPQEGLDATTGAGGALFYNLDPSVTNFVSLAFQNPDAGPDCQPQNAAYGFTGRAYVAGNAVSVFPILLP